MTKVPRHQIAHLLAQKSLQNVPAKKLAKEIASYLLSERRTAEIESIVRDIMQYRADQGIVEVHAVYAHPLTDAIRKSIKADVREIYPQAKQIIINEEQDESVVAGIKLELANQQLDASVRSKLNRFKQLTSVGKDL